MSDFETVPMLPEDDDPKVEPAPKAGEDEATMVNQDAIDWDNEPPAPAPDFAFEEEVKEDFASNDFAPGIAQSGEIEKDEKNSKKTWIIVGVVAAVLILCCCVVVIGGGIIGANEGMFNF